MFLHSLKGSFLFIFFVLINEETRRYLKDRKKKRKLKMKDIHDMISRNKEGGNLSVEEDEDEDDDDDDEDDENGSEKQAQQQQHDDVFEKKQPPDALGESVNINSSSVSNYNSLGVAHNFVQSLSERHLQYQATSGGDISYQRGASLRYTSSLRSGEPLDHPDFVHGISSVFNKSLVTTFIITKLF